LSVLDIASIVVIIVVFVFWLVVRFWEWSYLSQG
jgi:hypothetical protein